MTRLLVDTHALLWWLVDDPSLSAQARDLIRSPVSEPLVSAATLWEIAIKKSLGKLVVPEDLPTHIEEQGFGYLVVQPAHAWQVRELPFHHRDPFDRVLIAQALVEQLPVVTADPRFDDYGVDVRW